jgi:hypothetical protein
MRRGWIGNGKNAKDFGRPGGAISLQTSHLPPDTKLS